MTKVNHTLPVAHQWLSLILYGGIILQVRNIHTSMLTVFGLFSFFFCFMGIYHLWVHLFFFCSICQSPNQSSTDHHLLFEIEKLLTLWALPAKSHIIFVCVCVCVGDQTCSNVHSDGLTCKLQFSFFLSSSLPVSFLLIGVNGSSDVTWFVRLLTELWACWVIECICCLHFSSIAWSCDQYSESSVDLYVACDCHDWVIAWRSNQGF